MIKQKTIAVAIGCMTLFSCLKIHAQELRHKHDSLGKVQEFGLGFTGFKSFSMQYRWGSEKKLYRITGSIGNSSSFGKLDGSSQQTSFLPPNINAVTQSTPANVGVALSFAILKLKPVTEKFGFLFGTTFGISYSYLQTKLLENRSNNYYDSTNIVTSVYNSSQVVSTHVIQPYVGLALGGYYKITPYFWLYAEIDPRVYYAFTITKNSFTSSDPQSYNPPNPVVNTRESIDNSHTHEFGISNLSNSLASLTLVYHFKK
jgi:hypothetical protein